MPARSRPASSSATESAAAAAAAATPDNVCVNANGACNGIGAIAASTITTTGDRSSGISAQSIGGGGGNGGYAVAISVGVFGSESFALGGKGGSAGGAGNVFVGANGAIVTHGVSSDGIIAQSIGGGGGDGGFAISATGGATYASVGLAFGGNGGHGNDAGTVTVFSTANITTTNDLSNGIFAQSIGGGGGNGGFSISAAAAAGAAIALDKSGSGANGADGKTVSVTSIGNISTGRTSVVQPARNRTAFWRSRSGAAAVMAALPVPSPAPVSRASTCHLHRAAAPAAPAGR